MDTRTATRLLLAGALFGAIAGGALSPLSASGSTPPVIYVVADPKPTACSESRERVVEIMRFARYSHVPWYEAALADADVVDDEYPGTDTIDAAFQLWWIEHYDEVLAELTADCGPSASYPPLEDLPPGWTDYPARGRSEATD